MSRIEIKNGYKYLVTGDKGFETWFRLINEPIVTEEEKPIVTEKEKPKKKKKIKNVENENDTLAS